MKTAQIVAIEAVTFGCPECGEPIEEPHTGSQFWKREDIEYAGNKAKCVCFGAKVKLSISKVPMWKEQ